MNRPASKSRGRSLLRAGGVLVVVVLALIRFPPGCPPTRIIVADPRQEGRTFDGLGAVSAGASSRLLIDYPEPQRSQILDYLFKPNFGAGIQHLKVEIGGDVNSTDGCEPSHMHEPGDENYTRGYEWWLMREAKKRNPAIILDCLAWGAPYWIGNGEFYSADMANYIAKFIKGAKRIHGVDIDYTGVWNELPYDSAWIKLLRRTLDAEGLTQVRIVASDEVDRGWRIVEDMRKDPELASAVYAVGVHYPNSVSPKPAKELGKPLWSTEDGPWHADWASAMALARVYNRNYVKGKITKTEIWSPVTSYYDNLPIPGSGLLRANSPWSGYFQVPATIWVTAHTTQFAQPGWRYLEGACVLIEGGSVVGLKSPGDEDYSVIIETMDAERPQTLFLRAHGRFAGKPLHVWRTNSREYFADLGVIRPRRGEFTLAADPRAIYSLTTTTGQRKGDFTPPPAKPFPFPFGEDFESYPEGATPRYFSDQAGIFEVVDRDQGGRALRQVVPRKGIEWRMHYNSPPETILGSLNWTDYEVGVDALIEKAGFVSLFGRVGRVPQGMNPPNGYWLKVSEGGDWELSLVRNIKGNVKDPRTLLLSGRVAFPAGQWHRLALNFSGAVIAVRIDDRRVGEIKDETYRAGMVGIGSGWHGARFDNLSVSPVKNE